MQKKNAWSSREKAKLPEFHFGGQKWGKGAKR